MRAVTALALRLSLGSWLIAAVGCDQLLPIGSVDSAAPEEHAAKFSEVYELLFPRSSVGQCDMCHALPAHDLVNGNLETGMTPDSAYEALVGTTSQSSRCMEMPMVMPHEPEMSLLYLKLQENPPCGVRMPNGGRALTADELEMVRSWIAAGAENN